MTTIRADAILYNGRFFVPTVYGQLSGNTQWVCDWAEFKAAGGVACLAEDQTSIELTLPEGYKFGCGFLRRVSQQ